MATHIPLTANGLSFQSKAHYGSSMGLGGLKIVATTLAAIKCTSFDALDQYYLRYYENALYSVS
jgi:hypothetical protein